MSVCSSICLLAIHLSSSIWLQSSRSGVRPYFRQFIRIQSTHFNSLELEQAIYGGTTSGLPSP